MELSEGYRQRFGGVGRLWGAAALPRLAAARVMVVGVGGVGSWTVEALARSGIGALTLVDLDDVCATNTNRQSHALVETVGQAKVAVLAARVRAINPECRVEAVMEFFTGQTAGRLLAARCAWVVDAIDDTPNKARLIAACRERGQPVLTVGGAGGRRDGTRVRAADLGEAPGDDLLRQVRRTLRREHGWEVAPGQRWGVPCITSAERPVFPQADGSCGAAPEAGASVRLDCAGGLGAGVFVTGAFGFAAAGEVVRRIAEGAPG